MDERISKILGWYDRIYLGGIPQIIRDETAFLSFICMLSGIEALAGYCDPNASGPKANGERFRNFVKTYFPEAYKPHAISLWEFRNGMIHGFSPRQFSITHHNPGLHLQKLADGAYVLNAEDFYVGYFQATRAYFTDLSQSAALQQNFVRRIDSPNGGAFAVGFVDAIQ